MSKKIAVIVIALLALSLTAFVPLRPLQATPGVLDSSFGSSGVALFNNLYLSTIAYANFQGMIVQSDGKIVVGGTVSSNGYPYQSWIALIRFNSDGSIDSSFGGNGNGTANLRIGYYFYAHGPITTFRGIALQPDGKILVVGIAYANLTEVIAVARLLPTGTLDSSFGTYFNGTIKQAIPGSPYPDASGIALQSDQKILVVGTSTMGLNQAITLLRFTAAGQLDTGFGTGGFAQIAFGAPTSGTNYYDTGSRIAVQSDGKIVAVGQVPVGYNQGFGLVRYTTSGTLDISFGGNGNGTVTVPAVGAGITGACGGVTISGLSILSNGKIVSVGSSGVYCDPPLMQSIVRLNLDGTRDTSFGSNGLVNEAVGTTTFSGLVLPSDGSIVTSGIGFAGTALGFSLTRYTINGTIDTTFGTQGTVSTPVAAQSLYGGAYSNQTDGKIVVATTTSSSTGDGIALARYIMSDTSAPSWTGATLAATNVGQTTLTLVWTPASDDVAVAGYRVYQGTTLLSTVHGNVLSYNVTGLTAATAYKFSVQAGDQAGNWGTNGPTLGVTTARGAPGLPLLPILILVAVIAGFGAALFLTTPKTPKPS